MAIRPMIRIARRALTWLIWALVAVGLTLRFTVRDRYFPLALIYYVTPIPALAIWIVLARFAGSPPTVWARQTNTGTPKSRCSPGTFSLWLVPLFCVWTIFSQFVDRSRGGSENDMRIVFWNVARLQAGVTRLATSLKAFDAPVIALVESSELNQENVDDWKRELSDYQVIGTGFGGLLAIKGTLQSVRWHALTPRSPCQQFDITVDGIDFTVLLVDIASDLARSRRPALLALAEVADTLSDRPVVIVGDFNTPDDSVWFAPLRDHHRLAFRERGVGYAATWPMPIPVLTLDQVWFNELVDVSRCAIGWTAYSDHRPVISDVSFRKTSTGQSRP